MFSGVGTALITPFTTNNEVDFHSLRKICQYQLENNVDALIVLGTTGESPVINENERKQILKTVFEEVKGKVPVIVGTGTNDTKHVIELNKIAEDFGADGLLIVNPYYNKGTQESLVAHYHYIAQNTHLPILLYNVPSRTGMNVLPETALKIFNENKNVVGIKEAGGNISQIAKLFAIKPEGFDVYSGNDDQTLPIMAMGGKGIISVLSNVFPREVKSITEAMFSGDLNTANRINNEYNSIMSALFVESNPSPIKYIMSKLGFCENILRLPLTSVTEKTKEILDREVEKLLHVLV